MTKKKKRILFIVICALLIIIISVYYLFFPHQTGLQTYFTYSPSDKQLLAALTSNQEITRVSLTKWDSIMFNLIKKHQLGDIYASRLYTYVYSAQRDAAFLSYNIKQTFQGSIEPVSAGVLCLFFSDSCAEIKEKGGTAFDPYSKLLAKIVLTKISARMKKDAIQIHPYPEKTPVNHYWVGVKPYYGQDAGSWMTWMIASGSEFKAPPPPEYNSPRWAIELNRVKNALKNVTPEQTLSIVFWAGNPNTVTPPGIWLIAANDYMFSHNIGLAKTLYVRSVLSMVIMDSLISVFNSKYTYWSKRPFMRDPSIHTVMPTPNHPSYPAAHSTLSAAAATVLSFFFPENKKEWMTLSTTASEGRVWGGIHFEIDAKQGYLLGNEVGKAALLKLKPITNETND